MHRESPHENRKQDRNDRSGLYRSDLSQQPKEDVAMKRPVPLKNGVDRGLAGDLFDSLPERDPQLA